MDIKVNSREAVGASVDWRERIRATADCGETIMVLVDCRESIMVASFDFILKRKYQNIKVHELQINS